MVRLLLLFLIAPGAILNAYEKVLDHIGANSSEEDLTKILEALTKNHFSFETSSAALVPAKEALAKIEKLAAGMDDALSKKLDEFKERRLKQARTQTRVRTSAKPGFTGATFSNDRSLLALHSGQRELHIVDVKSKQIVAKIEPSSYAPKLTAFSPDNKLLAGVFGLDGKSIYFFDTKGVHSASVEGFEALGAPEL